MTKWLLYYGIKRIHEHINYSSPDSKPTMIRYEGWPLKGLTLSVRIH